MTLPHLPAPLSRTQVFAELARAGWSFIEASRGEKSGGGDDGLGGDRHRPPPPSTSSSFVVRAPPRGPRASNSSSFPFGSDDGRMLAAPWLPSSYRRPHGPEQASEALASAAGAVAAARLSASALAGDARWCRAAAEDLGRIASAVRAAASSESSGAWVKCFEKQKQQNEANDSSSSGKNKKNKSKKKKKSAAAAAAAARSASRALLDVSTAMTAAAKAVKRACAAPRMTTKDKIGGGGEAGGGEEQAAALPPLRYRLSASSVLECVAALDAAFFALWEHFVSCPWDCPATVPAPHAYFPFVASKSPAAAHAWRRLVSGPGRAAAPAWARAWGLGEFAAEEGGAEAQVEEEAAAAALVSAVEETLSSSSASASDSSVHPLLRLIHARAAEGASLLWASGLVGSGGTGGGGARSAGGGAAATAGAAAAAATASAAAAALEKRKDNRRKRSKAPSPQSSCTSSDSDAVSSSDSDFGSSDSDDDDCDDDDEDVDDEDNVCRGRDFIRGGGGDAVPPLPPSTFDNDLLDPNATAPWPANASLAAWRASMREIHSYSYAVPVGTAIRKMLSFSPPCSSSSSPSDSSSPSWVEIGAGVGFWAAAMREELSETASRVLAVDIAARKRKEDGGGGGGRGSGSGESNQWHGRVPAVSEVELGGPDVLVSSFPSSSSSSAPPPSLLLCYPPPDGAMACAALAAVTPAEGERREEETGGKTQTRFAPVIAVVGEVAGDTGGRAFWRALSSSTSSNSCWRCVLRERLPDWSDTAAELLVFRFSESKSKSTKENDEKSPLPLVACSVCGSAPATRRCRHCRSHALCGGEECCRSFNGGGGGGGGGGDDEGGAGGSAWRRHAAEHALRLLPAPEAPGGSLWEALPAFLWRRESSGDGKGSKKEAKKKEKRKKRKKGRV